MAEALSTLESRLLASGLVTADQLAKCRAALGESADDAKLVELLIRLDLLTKWQAAQLQAGKERSLSLEHYKLLDPLGAGGMGQVFRALDTELNRQVAIKILPRRSTSRDAIERFRREGMASLQVQHEHIVRSFELGQQGDTHFLVMELVVGTNLAKYIEKKGRLGVQETARIGHEVSLALEHARECGIIHRDIKPSNILLTKKGAAKLADLGLAKFFGARPGEDRPATLTHSGAFMGTVDYCAPEQAEDAKRADTRSDIYSLGCTLYHCLTGHPPFAGGTAVQKIVAHRERDPDSISALNDNVPQLLSDLIAKRMLAKLSEDRFGTPADVAAALQPWATGNPAASDMARLASLIEEDQAGYDVMSEESSRRDSAGSTKRRGSSQRRSPRLRWRNVPASGAIAVTTVLRAIFRMLVGRASRLLILVTFLVALFCLWHFDPIGLRQYAPKSWRDAFGLSPDLSRSDSKKSLPANDPRYSTVPADSNTSAGSPSFTDPASPPGSPSGVMPSSPGMPSYPGSGGAAAPRGPGGGFPGGSPPGDSLDLARLSATWNSEALTKLQNEGPAGYRQFCTQLLEKYESASLTPVAANNLAWTCVLAPDAVDDPARIVRLAEQAIAGLPGQWFILNTYGAALYRAGRYAQCIEKINESVSANGTGGDASDWLFRAMAEHRLGQRDQARQSFEKGVAMIQRRSEPQANRELQLFWREAESLLNDTTANKVEGEPTKNGLLAELYAGKDFDRKIKSRTDLPVDSRIWVGGWPDKDLPRGPFSIRWTGWIKAPRPGRYKLITLSDDGVRVRIDGKVVIDQWRAHAPTRHEVEVTLTDKPHAIRIDYYELYVGSWTMVLSWSQRGAFGEQVVPVNALWHDLGRNESR